MRELRQELNLLPGFHRDPIDASPVRAGFYGGVLAALNAGRSIPDLTASKYGRGFGEKNGARVSHCVYQTKELAPHCSENGWEMGP